MPGYKEHIVGAIFFWGLCLLGMTVFEMFKPSLFSASVLLVIAVLGALFPDVDTNSKGQHIIYGIILIADIILIVSGQFILAAMLGFFALFPAIGSHRGWTHTWWAMFIVPLPIIFLPKLYYNINLIKVLPYYTAWVFGYLSHLILDKKM